MGPAAVLRWEIMYKIILHIEIILCLISSFSYSQKSCKFREIYLLIRIWLFRPPELTAIQPGWKWHHLVRNNAPAGSGWDNSFYHLQCSHVVFSVLSEDLLGYVSILKLTCVWVGLHWNTETVLASHFRVEFVVRHRNNLHTTYWVWGSMLLVYGYPWTALGFSLKCEIIGRAGLLSILWPAPVPELTD